MNDHPHENSPFTDLIIDSQRALIFLRDAGEVQKILAFKKVILANQIDLVALAPGALLTLQHYGLPHVIPEDFHGSDELAAFEAEVRSRVLSIVREIDEHLAKHDPLIRRTGLRLAAFHLRVFDNIISSLSRALFQTSKIIEALKPDRIGVFDLYAAPAVRLPEIDPMFWGRHLNLFTLALEALDAGIDVVDLTDENRNGAASAMRLESWRQWPHPLFGLRLQLPASVVAKIKGMIGMRPRWNFLAATLRQKGVAAGFRETLPKKAGLGMLLIKGAYDWEAAEKALNAQGLHFRGRLTDEAEMWSRNSLPVSSPQHLKVLNELTRTPAFRRHFVHGRADLFPIVHGKLRYFMETVVPMALHAYAHTGKFLESKKIGAVVFAINPSAVSKCMTWAARNKGIPVIGWQHGDTNSESYYAHTLSELAGTDLFITWGEGSRNHRLEHGRGLPCIMEPWGSASLGAAAQQASKVNRDAVIHKVLGRSPGNQKIIVYATTNYYLNYSYSPALPPWSDNLLCRTQQSLIRSLAKLNAVKIIKLHPHRVHLEPGLVEYCESYKRNGIITISDEYDFTELLAIADAVVIDWPTTTLLQAMAMGKPVFCLSTHRKFSVPVEAMLRKRAVLEDKPEVLMERLGAFVNTNAYQPDCSDTAFLQHLGAPLDARGCELLVRRLKEFISEFPRRAAQKNGLPERRLAARPKIVNHRTRRPRPVGTYSGESNDR